MSTTPPLMSGKATAKAAVGAGITLPAIARGKPAAALAINGYLPGFTRPGTGSEGTTAI
jgi:hypothetical protein